ncbi:hypothetical protein Ait01nite_041610 [Actinoplanes italicus]|nr:hypothetical protein Ait01nite_041610 [Actinoplanes italicus]
MLSGLAEINGMFSARAAVAPDRTSTVVSRALRYARRRAGPAKIMWVTLGAAPAGRTGVRQWHPFG